jgi:hypothetical protein
MTPSPGKPPAPPDQPPRTRQPAPRTWTRTVLAAQVQHAGPGLEHALQQPWRADPGHQPSADIEAEP